MPPPHAHHVSTVLCVYVRVASPMGSTILGEYAPLAMSSSVCANKVSWGGFICTGVTYRAVSLRPRSPNQAIQKVRGWSMGVCGLAPETAGNGVSPVIEHRCFSGGA
jgi:hypothetical protein